MRETARADIVNTADEKMLADIIFRYGEERWSRKIASAIVRARNAKPMETTGELADIVLGAIPKRFHVKNIHPATRVFQALRIAVNDELARDRTRALTMRTTCWPPAAGSWPSPSTRWKTAS